MVQNFQLAIYGRNFAENGSNSWGGQNWKVQGGGQVKLASTGSEAKFSGPGGELNVYFYALNFRGLALIFCIYGRVANENGTVLKPRHLGNHRSNLHGEAQSHLRKKACKHVQQM